MVKPASVWKRILAFLLDLYLCVMVFAALFVIIERDIPNSISEAIGAALTPAAMTAVLYASLLTLLYHVFCEYIIGQTAGMLIFGISVENKKEKEGLKFWQAVVRNLFMVPVFPLTLLWIIEPLFYVFQGQRLLEYWSGTDTVQ